MTMHVWYRRSLGVLGLAAFAACASGGGGGAEPQAAAGEGVTIVVNNDLVPPDNLTIYINPEQGSRRRLGVVAPNGTGTFSYSPGVTASDHRIVAERAGGGSNSSNPFVLTGVTRVTWSVSGPVVNIVRGQRP